MLKDCTTKVEKGEVIVVCGPSGSGKSTLIKVVNALEPFQKGDIVVDGIKVNDPKTDLPKLRARVGMVFQNFELFPHLTITQNLTLGQIKVLGRRTDEAVTRGLKIRPRRPDLAEGQVPRPALRRRSSASGWRSRASMDRSGCCSIRADAGLDPEMVNEVLRRDGAAREREDDDDVRDDHEMGFARKVAKRVIFMDQGSIVEDATKEDFFGKPRSERAQQFLAKILHH